MRDLTAMYLDELHVTELDGAALLTTDGGGLPELLWKAVEALVVCVANNADSLVDGFQEGAAGHY